MTDQHRATPEQWEDQERWAFEEDAYSFCILELRDRIATLETQNNEDANCWAMVRSSMHAFRERLEVLEASLGIGHPVTPANTSAPADSLVGRVASICASASDDEPEVWKPEARAAIREVAAWLKERERRGLVDLSEALEQEAKR
jgi:hypothetical protein